MEIRFIRSRCPDPHNGLGYRVWTDKYTGEFQEVGFTSNKNLDEMKKYFIDEGYRVSVIDDPDFQAGIVFNG